MLNSNLGLNNRISIAAEQNDPNCGFQTLKYDFASQHPCTPESLKAARADDPLSATSFEFKVSIATSKEELIQHLDIEASGRAAVWGATVKGSASYMKDLSFTEETIVVAMTARQVIRQSVFDPNQLVLQNDAKLRMEQQDFKGFYLRYGAYVPARITEGATITLFMKRSCSSRTEKQKIAAALGAQGGGYKADASVAKEAAKTLNDHKFEIQAFGKGRAEPIDQDILKMTASEAVKWAFSTWLNSAAEPTAISAELINVWSLRGADPDFESWVEGPTFKKEALTDAIIDVEALKGTCDYILNAGDLTKPAAGVAKEVEAYRLGLGKAKTALKESIRRSDSGMDYPLADDVLDAPLGSQSRESIAARLDAIKSDLAKPILTGKSKFKLRLTGQSVAYIGKKKGKNPQAVTSPGAADVFTFDGVNPVVGASICLRAASANALLRCEKAGSEITYDVHTYDSRKWKIVKKKSGGDNHLRIGDEIMIQNVMLANAQNPNNKAKKAQDVGIKEDTAKKKIVGHIQKSHYLLIVKV